MEMPGRKWVFSDYRLGYNKGSQKDDEISGSGNNIYTFHRELETRIGRWWSVDPESEEYPDESPYASMENNPISENDPNGDCPWCIMFIKGAVQEYATQVATNFAEGKDWKEAFTKIDGEAVLESAILDGVTLGVGSIVKKATTVVKIAKAADKAMDVEKAAVKVNKVAKTTEKVSKVEKNVSKAEWKAKIVGKAQKTGTPGHQTKSYKEAIKAAKDSKVKKVYLNKGYNKAAELNPGTIKPNRRPDVTVVKKDGTVNPIEVQSKTDNPTQLINRNKESMKQLPANQQGDIKVVQPSKIN